MQQIQEFDPEDLGVQKWSLPEIANLISAIETLVGDEQGRNIYVSKNAHGKNLYGIAYEKELIDWEHYDIRYKEPVADELSQSIFSKCLGSKTFDSATEMVEALSNFLFDPASGYGMMSAWDEFSWKIAGFDPSHSFNALSRNQHDVLLEFQTLARLEFLSEEKKEK